ncbi:hypothetical protein [Salipiger mucosus]|uniref:Alkaline phosphatase n=1 Tax=Salipiger mucosus DSM 16094 TaxID=1123237 RepID=S9QRM1_9RHOB|nr:hypothetical protein [Salipiger mucosus]EPX84036.1 Alkaline phosphatase [Salipiger mucosus DSM 16094]
MISTLSDLESLTLGPLVEETSGNDTLFDEPRAQHFDGDGAADFEI